MEGTAAATRQANDIQFSPDRNGYTPLMRTILENREDDVLELIRQVPHVGLLDIQNERDHKTALHLAVENFLTRCVKQLLILSASLRLKDNRGNTPLHVACISGDAKMLKLLLANTNEEGQQGREIFLRVLLDTRNDEGFTCFHLAVHSGYPRAIRVVAEHGADVNAKDKHKDWTALHFAAHGGNTALVECLLKYTNVDLDERTPEGRTAFDLATDENNKETAALLRQLQRGELEQGSIRVSASDSDDSEDVSLWDVSPESLMRPAIRGVQASAMPEDEDSFHLLARGMAKNTQSTLTDDSLEGAVGYTRHELYLDPKASQKLSDKTMSGVQTHEEDENKKLSLSDNPVEKMVGLAILLNILHFPSRMQQRTASIGLAGDFRNTFTEYGYVQKVLSREGQTENVEKIRLRIETFLKENVHRLTDDSCVFTWVCSHGSYGTVICSDGTELPITALMDAVKSVITVLRSCTLLFLICACQQEYPRTPGANRCPYFESAHSNTLVMVSAGPKQVDFEARTQRVVATAAGQTTEDLADESGNPTALAFLDEMNNTEGSPLVKKLWKKVKKRVTAKHPTQEGYAFPNNDFSKTLRIPRKGVPPF